MEDKDTIKQFRTTQYSVGKLKLLQLYCKSTRNVKTIKDNQITLSVGLGMFVIETDKDN